MTLLDKIQGYFVNEFSLSPLDSTKLRYSLEVIFNEVSKLIILLIIGVTILTIHFLIACLFTNKHPYIINSTWVFVLRSIQLLIAKGVNIYEKEKFYNEEAN